jgi:hypothetical protein
MLYFGAQKDIDKCIDRSINSGFVLEGIRASLALSGLKAVK